MVRGGEMNSMAPVRLSHLWAPTSSRPVCQLSSHTALRMHVTMYLLGHRLLLIYKLHLEEALKGLCAVMLCCVMSAATAATPARSE